MAIVNGTMKRDKARSVGCNGVAEVSEARDILEPVKAVPVKKQQTMHDVRRPLGTPADLHFDDEPPMSLDELREALR